MEPVTHVLTGACLARAGLNRRAAYTTVAMAIAAELPDIDTVWSLRGPVAGFQHHRGITHTFLGIPFEAALLFLCFYGVHRFRSRGEALANARQLGRLETSSAPVQWGWFYLFLILALLSHVLLDYTNNYGIRPFFPFDSHWYAGSFVFIFDPVLFLLLVAGLSLPALFGLIGREIGVRRELYRGRGWARAALFCVLLLWTLRWVEHGRAVGLAQTQVVRAPGSEAPDAIPSEFQPAAEVPRATLIAQRSLASPDPLSIFRWYTATDFGPVQQLAVADVRNGTIVPGPTFTKAPATPILLTAERSPLGRAYMDWSPMPVLSFAPGAPDEMLPPGAIGSATTVSFADPRFMGDSPLLHAGSHPPLTGEVVIDAHGNVVAQGMDGRFGR